MLKAAYNVLKYSVQHPIGRVFPVQTAARVLRWQLASRLAPGPTLVDWVDGAKLIVARGMVGATGNVYVGLHEFADMAFVLHYVRPSDLVIDVGANVGTYTVLAAAVCGARVHAFEPSPGTFERLRANVVVNECGERVSLIRAAVGDQAGELLFTVGLDATNRAASAADKHTEYVPSVRLDDQIQDEAALVKVDTEGFEARVVSGGEKTFSRAGAALLEIAKSDVQMIGKMRELGLLPYTYEPFSRSLEPGTRGGSNNCLFLRDPDAVAARVAAAKRRTILGVKV